jgi:hypothetical protein
MANKATITYNGKTISTEDRDGSFAVTYNGSTLATLGAGQSKTLNCSGQPMKSDVVVGGKILRCKNLKMHSNVVVSVVSLFPSEPSAYNLIGTYTSSQTWTAPESGYFQIEVFGASGKGGAADFNAASMGATGASGGGGGGGGYACSRVKLKKGDTVVIVRGAVGATSSATINSTLESYSTVSVTSGENGGDADCSRSNTNASNVDAGTGGAGGTAYGGNYSNKNGNDGSAGGKNYVRKNEGPTTINGGAGGSSGYTGGNAGGAGGKVRIIGWEKAESQEIDNMIYSASSGKAGFIKIYRGNTNVA